MVMDSRPVQGSFEKNLLLMNMKPIIVLLAFLHLPALVIGQSPAGESWSRKGFVFGAGLGGGVLLQGQAGSTAVFPRLAYPNWKIGWMLNERQLLMIHAPGASYFSDEGERAFEGILLSGQQFVGRRMYLLGGAGLAMDLRPFYKIDFSQGAPEDFQFGPGAFLGAGYELLRFGRRGSLDLAGRVFSGRFTGDGQPRSQTAFDLMLAVNWY